MFLYWSLCVYVLLLAEDCDPLVGDLVVLFVDLAWGYRFDIEIF